MKRKIVGIILMLFLISMFLPNINAIRTIEKNILTEDNNEGLVGNLSIGTESPYLRIIITNIFEPNSEISYLFLNYISNHNIINVTVEQQIKLESVTGFKIYCEHNITSIIKKGWSTIWTFHEEDFSGCLFGFVKYKWTIKVLEDNSSVTKNLLGFAFKYGVKWFFNH